MGDTFTLTTPGKSHLSEDGLELVTQCNHLSHFLLTNLLADRLALAGAARVINVSSIFALFNGPTGGRALDMDNINYEKDHSPRALKFSYHNSKLMNVLFRFVHGMWCGVVWCSMWCVAW